MNLLIVDDNKYVVEGLKHQLDWSKYDFTHIFSGYDVMQAKKIFLSAHIDLLICDIEMPCQNGFDLLKWVRDKGYDTDIILLTAYMEFSYAQRAIVYNVFRYLLKPVDTDELSQVISTYLQKKKTAESQNRLTRNRYNVYTEKENSYEQISDRIKDYINAHLDSINRKDIAKQFYLSESYISKLFHRETGQSLSSYIQMQRMKKAQSLLTHTNKSVGEIASEVGYPSTSFFSKQFSRFPGVTPTDYRRKNQEKNS